MIRKMKKSADNPYGLFFILIKVYKFVPTNFKKTHEKFKTQSYCIGSSHTVIM